MPNERILPRTYRLACVASVLMVQFLCQPSLAFNISPGQPGAANLSARTAIYTIGTDQKAAFLNPFGIEPLIRGGTVEFLNTLNSDFPAWTFNASTTDLNGSFNIINYYACGFNTSCGLELGLTSTNGVGSFIDVDYIAGAGDPTAGTDLHWIQRVANNHHLSLGHGSTDDKVDIFSGATDPYYDTVGFAGIGSTVGLPLRPFVFVDRPYRSDELGNHDWVAELYLVEQTAPNTATIYNGMRWGWGNIDSTANSTSQTSFIATFATPLPEDATHTGIGTNSITWGIPFSAADVSSALSITPQPYGNPVIGEPFVAGLITYTNGTVQGGTGLTSVVLEQQNVINIPGLRVSDRRVDDNRTITMNNTPNTSDPIASADFVSIPPAPGIGTEIFPNIGNNFHVIEGQTATATLLGRIVEADVEDITKPDADPIHPPFPDDPRGQNPQQQQFVFEWLGYGEVVRGNGRGFVTIDAIVPCKNGDIDCDGDVDFADFSVLAENFTGTITPPERPGTGGKRRDDGDFDGDGDVDFGDFSTLAGTFTGTITAPANDLPENGDVYLVINRETGVMALVPNNANLAGYSIRSIDSQIVPDADGAAAPFQFYLLNAPQEVTAGSVGSTTMLLTDLALDISFAGDAGQAANVVFQYTRTGEVTPVDGLVHVIPEPATLILLAAGGLIVMRYRRRWCA